MNKKQILIGVAIAAVVGTSFWMAFGDSSFSASLSANGGILNLKSDGSANLKLLTHGSDTIDVSLTGPDGKIKRTRFFKSDGGDYFFDFSDPEDESEPLEGTITVPEGMALTVDLSGQNSLTVNGHKGKLKLTTNGNAHFNSPGSTFQDPSVTSNGSGQISLGGFSGDLTIENNGTGAIETGDGDPDHVKVTGDGKGIVLPPGQTLLPPGTTPPQPQNQGQPTTPTPVIPCSEGTAEVQSACCSQLNQQSATPQCVGQWRFDGGAQSCLFHCYNQQELEIYYGQVEEQAGEVSLDCAQKPSEERNDCCNDQLKNPLSIGPRKGFPDCVGKWAFVENHCSFACSSYGEMLQIMEEIQARNGQNQ